MQKSFSHKEGASTSLSVMDSEAYLHLLSNTHVHRWLKASYIHSVNIAVTLYLGIHMNVDIGKSLLGKPFLVELPQGAN